MQRRGSGRCRWRPPGAGLGGDTGSAIAEFVLVGAMVTLLFLAVLQLGVDLYLRNVLAVAAADGARYGANADVASVTAAEDHAAALARRILGPVAGRVAVAGDVEPLGDRSQLVLRLAAPLPTAFGLLPSLPVRVEGRALVEGVP